MHHNTPKAMARAVGARFMRRERPADSGAAALPPITVAQAYPSKDSEVQLLEHLIGWADAVRRTSCGDSEADAARYDLADTLIETILVPRWQVRGMLPFLSVGGTTRDGEKLSREMIELTEESAPDLTRTPDGYKPLSDLADTEPELCRSCAAGAKSNAWVIGGDGTARCYRCGQAYPAPEGDTESEGEHHDRVTLEIIEASCNVDLPSLLAARCMECSHEDEATHGVCPHCPNGAGSGRADTIMGAAECEWCGGDGVTCSSNAASDGKDSSDE